MLNFTAQRFGAIILFRCAGRFVSGDAERLRDAIHAQTNARAIVLGLAEISTIDAAGVGMLASVHGWAKSIGRGFKLMNLSPRVEEVVEITNLDSVLEVCSVPEMLDVLCETMRHAEPESAVDTQPSGQLTESALVQSRPA